MGRFGWAVTAVTEIRRGTRFGRLTVRGQASSDHRGAAQWVCECDCGNEITTTGHRLRTGQTVTCGVLGCRQRIEAKGLEAAQ
jgi:hypothetical protein